MTSLGLPDLRSGVATSLKESSDFLSRWLVGGGGPLEDTKQGRDLQILVVHFSGSVFNFEHIIVRIMRYKMFWFCGFQTGQHSNFSISLKSKTESEHSQNVCKPSLCATMERVTGQSSTRTSVCRLWWMFTTKESWVIISIPLFLLVCSRSQQLPWCIQSNYYKYKWWK